MSKRGRLRALAAGVYHEDGEEELPTKVRILAPQKRSSVDARSCISFIELAIDEIFTRKNASRMSFEQLYRHGYNLVQHQHGGALFNAVHQKLVFYLASFRSSILAAVETGLALPVTCQMWSDFTKALQVIREVLSPLDRTLGTCTIFETGVKLWREQVVLESSVQGNLKDALLNEIHRERSGEIIDRGMLRTTINMLIDLEPRVYMAVFEEPFLVASDEFYSREAQQVLVFSDCSEVLKQVMKRLQEEGSRVTSYLTERLRPKLSSIVVRNMIGGKLQQLVEMENTGLHSMLTENRCGDLERMYELFRHESEGVSILCATMVRTVEEGGKQLVQNSDQQKDPVVFVGKLLEYWSKYESIINVCFKKNRQLESGLGKAFERFLSDVRRMPEFLSLYIDSKLRHGEKLDDQGMEEALDKALVLFRFLSERDVFEKYYKHHLAKRLITSKSIDEEAERSFVVKLKSAGGYQFTLKMENMLNDMKNSADLGKQFSSSGVAPSPGEPGIQVQVLTTGSWPPYPSAKCVLPVEIQKVAERFKMFYLKQHRGRRFTWQFNLGDADLRLNLGDSSKLLNVNTYQMCILMLFNESDRLSFGEIEQGTGIPKGELQRNLQSLALVKGKNVLVKEPMSKEINDWDVFRFNEGFSSKLARIKLCRVAAQKESGEESGATMRRVEEERRLQIEAAVVRVMKSRQVMEHNALMSEVAEQLQPRFTPNPVAVKQRIEALIDREFLERDPDDRRRYRYLA